MTKLVTRNCEFCGTVFSVYLSNPRRFCSRACSDPHKRKRPAIERLLKWTNKTASCWLWTGTADRRGYGHLTINGKQYLAHRIMWEETNGPVPIGVNVLHRCDVSACVNPAHLFLGTQGDNVRDMIHKGRMNPRWGATCKCGHLRTPENTYVFPKSRARACRVCIKDRSVARYRE